MKLIKMLMELFGICRYKTLCKHYRKNNKVCNKDAGGYYSDELRKAGCYVRMAKCL